MNNSTKLLSLTLIGLLFFSCKSAKKESKE